MIDLSSDTATRPSAAMREAMMKAEVGDEQRLEDPTVLALIERTCDLLGKPAGLFLPSGTMCNLIAVRTHTRPGDTVFVGSTCHILRCETGAAAAVSGVVLEPIQAERGCFGAPELEAALFEPSNYSPVPSLVCLEQSHNFGGGAVWPLERLRDVQGLARQRGLRTHMDGARLFNAVVASGVSAADYAATVDSVWVDFTKGLGAPMGAVLCGESDFIERARRFKHMFGGAMRQAGIAAAGCLYALDHHIERLADDHRRATDLAQFLNGFDQVTVQPPDTNLLFFRAGPRKAADILRESEQRGVRMSQVGDTIRAVTHLDITDQDMEQAKTVLGELLS